MVARTRQKLFEWRPTETFDRLRASISETFESNFVETPLRRDRRVLADRAESEPATELKPSARALAREQVVNRILDCNPSADVGFLEEFSDERLAVYLERLEALETPRGPEARWIRSGESPAIVVRVRRD